MKRKKLKLELWPNSSIFGIKKKLILRSLQMQIKMYMKGYLLHPYIYDINIKYYKQPKYWITASGLINC